MADVSRRCRQLDRRPATVAGLITAVAAGLLLAGCAISGTTTQRQAISRALVTADGRHVVVPFPVGGCMQRSILTATETASRVTLVLKQILSGGFCAADLTEGTTAAVLRHPLSGRALVDGTSGRGIPYFDGRKLPRITYLPPGYRFSQYFPAAAGGWERRFVSADRAYGMLHVVQVPGSAAVLPAWPVQSRTEVDGHPATVQIGSEGGQVYVRAISWAADGYAFDVYSEITQASPPLGVAELTRIAAGCGPDQRKNRRGAKSLEAAHGSKSALVRRATACRVSVALPRMRSPRPAPQDAAAHHLHLAPLSRPAAANPTSPRICIGRRPRSGRCRSSC